MKRTVDCFCLFVLALFVPALAFAQAQPAAQSTAQKPAAASPAAKPKPAATAATSSPLLHPETLKAKAPEVFEAKFVTTKGDFVVQVTRAWAPNGADRFYNLVKRHYYDGNALFRVVTGFVVQFGLGPNPAINKAWMNASIKDDAVTQSNTVGYVTYAAGGANTRTTQVFINLGNNARLDSYPDHFAPFGIVTSGMDVIKQFYAGYADDPTGHQGEITNEGKVYLEKHFPKLDVIKSATIISPAPAPAAPAKKPAASAAKPAAPSGAAAKP
ncbi:MAG: peptidylprolyl isomerase [Candidatus Acidiferrales bacterium]